MIHEDVPPTGDPRRCQFHPHVRTSSADGMHDAPCGECEAESDLAAADAPLDKEGAMRYLFTYGSYGSEWEEAGLLRAVSTVFFSEDGEFQRPALDEMLEEARNN